MSTPISIRLWPESEEIQVGVTATQRASVGGAPAEGSSVAPPIAGIEVTFVVDPQDRENVAMTLTATTDATGTATIAYTRAHPGADRMTAFVTDNPLIRAHVTKTWSLRPGSERPTPSVPPTTHVTAVDPVSAMLRGAGRAIREASASLTHAGIHRGEAGRARELRLAEELRDRLPRRFAVTRGAILGRGGQLSTDQDLLICDLFHHGAFPYEGGHLVVPESVLVVMQVRTNIAPSDIAKHAEAAREVAEFIERSTEQPWTGYYCVVGHRLDGEWGKLVERYAQHLLDVPRGRRISLLAALDAGVAFDQLVFDDHGVPAFLAARSHVPGPSFDLVVTTPEAEPFVDFYRLLLRGLARIRPVALAIPTVEESYSDCVSIDPETASVSGQYAAVYAGRSFDLVLRPGQIGTFTLFFANVGSGDWTRGAESQCELSVADPPGHTTPFDWVLNPTAAGRYCGHTQTRVPPGSIATFTFNVLVPDDADPGDHRFYLRPMVAGRGVTPEARACVVRVAT